MCPTELARLLCPWASPGENTGAGCHTLLQEVFPTQGSILRLLRLLHCRRIIYHWATRDAQDTAYKSASDEVCPFSGGGITPIPVRLVDSEPTSETLGGQVLLFVCSSISPGARLLSSSRPLASPIPCNSCRQETGLWKHM